MPFRFPRSVPQVRILVPAVTVAWAVAALLSPAHGQTPGQGPPAAGELTIKWDQVTATSRTAPSFQVVVNPPLRRGSPIHDNAFAAIRDMGASYVRFVPWLPYPRLGVAELEPPSNGKTSWDFSLIDPLTIDFLEATKGHPVMLNFSTMPAWMWKTDRPVTYPDDPDQVVWNYTQGDEPRDTTMKEIADYYARLISWYTRGGFTDELGKRHESGHHYDVSHWEVLNEPDLEHHLSAEMYTRLYDEIVTAMREVSPRTRFGGISLASPDGHPEYFTYFLNPANHKPGVPIDFITYHFYATPGALSASPGGWPALFFTQADQFLTSVKWIEAIRTSLSPSTKSYVNEVGSIALGHNDAEKLPDFYWNLSGSVYAYLFGQMSRMGIDGVHESQLVGYPTQFPSVSMVDWTTGKGNARYWVLKLIHDNFGPGDRIVQIASRSVTTGPEGFARRVGEFAPYAYAVVGKDGRRRVMLVNRTNASAAVEVPGAGGGTLEYVDLTTGLNPPAGRRLSGDLVTLNPLAVAVVEMP